MGLSRVTWGCLAATSLVVTATPVIVGISVTTAATPRLSWPDVSVAGSSQSAARAAVATGLQASEPVTLLSPLTKRRKKDNRGDRFVQVSATGSNDVPEAALRAYKNAAETLEDRKPGCRLPWTLLAGIGRVESDHGRYGDSVLGSDGVSRPAILGLPLNGVGPVAAIHDTDKGKLDGDAVWDRAVGQMQFIPSTWRMVAADGDGDGVESPNDLDDAAVAAGYYLCHGGFSVDGVSGMARAVFSYNHSDYYVALVMAYQRGYETGVFFIPSPPPPPGADDGLPDVTAAAKQGSPTKKQPAKQQQQPTKKPPVKTPAPTQPTAPAQPKETTAPTPVVVAQPEPDPTPTGPRLTFDTGSFTACGDGYCLGGLHLDLGPAAQLGRQAAHDYDGDGTSESNAEEFAGLVGTSVRLGHEGEVVYVVGDKDYRFADGSFA